MSTDEKQLVECTIAMLKEALSNPEVVRIKVEWTAIDAGSEYRQMKLVPKVTVEIDPWQ